MLFDGDFKELSKFLLGTREVDSSFGDLESGSFFLVVSGWVRDWCVIRVIIHDEIVVSGCLNCVNDIVGSGVSAGVAFKG